MRPTFATLLTTATLAAGVAVPLCDNDLPHKSAFGSLLQTIAPYVTTSDLERFLHQFVCSDGRRSLQGASAFNPSPVTLDPSIVTVDPGSITDHIAPQASNGWIDHQSWRTFDSSTDSLSGASVQLHYVTVRGNGTRGGVVVSVGHTEPVDKYAEQLFDLQQAGFSPIYALDHRGQGRSSRLLADTFKSHVEEAAHFVSDFRAFVTLADAEMRASGVGHGKRFLHCHSMGCAVAFTYLIEEYYAQRANVFHAVGANAPLIKPVTDPFPYSVAVLIGQTMVALGLGEAYPPTRGKTFDELYAFDATRPARQSLHYEANCHAKRATSYSAGHTGLCLGDVTANFAKEFFGMYDAFAEFTRGKLSVPILLQQAKTNADGHDGKVINAPQEAFCTDAADKCTLTRYPTSSHNIWFEADSIRTPALAEVAAFYDANAASVVQQNSLPSMCSWWEFWCAGDKLCDCIWSCKHPAARC